MVDMNESKLSPGERFIERMGVVAEEEGIPRICGRLLGLMLLDGGPLSFDDIADRLQVSRSSVSTNTRLLETRGIIERTGLPGDRHTYYRLADDPYGQMLATTLRRKRQMTRVVEEALETLPAEEEGARRRLERMHRFHEIVIQNLESVIEAWTADRAEEDEGMEGREARSA